MDPQTTLSALLEALSDEDWELAMELSQALQTWIQGGGFPPTTIGAETLGQNWHRAIASAICNEALALGGIVSEPIE